MRRIKRFAAVLLSAAMVLTSFPAEAFAGAETIVVEEGISSMEEADVPAAAETSSEDTGEAPAEDSTGAYTQYHIYTEADLVSALDGTAAIDGKVTALPAILEEDIALTAPRSQMKQGRRLSLIGWYFSSQRLPRRKGRS